MKKKSLASLSLALIAVGLLAIAGCTSEPATPTPADTSAQSEQDWTDGLEEKVVQAFTELSEADRRAALAQKTCPVADGPLGGMGKPVKVTIQGRDVYLCCAACEPALRDDPEQYLQKLDAK